MDGESRLFFFVDAASGLCNSYPMKTVKHEVWSSPKPAVPMIVGRKVGYLVAPAGNGQIRKVGTCPKKLSPTEVEKIISRKKAGSFILFGGGKFEYVESVDA